MAWRGTAVVWVLAALLVTLAGGCACVCAPPQGAAAQSGVLSSRWLIGVDAMRGDPSPSLPFTNRLIADLAAMPGTAVVATDTERNAFLFEADRSDKLRVATTLGGDGACMTAIYTIWRGGQQQGAYGLTIPRLAAGIEPDSACVDRFATDFYQALVAQGL